MNASTARRRPLGTGRLMLISMVIGLACGGVIAFADGLQLGDRPVIYGAGVLAVGLLILVLSLRWWKDADEAVREAHKFSWFWGGSAGLVPVCAAGIALMGIAQGDAGAWGLTPAEAGMILTGIAGTVGTLLAGYGLCWAGWWLVRSR